MTGSQCSLEGKTDKNLRNVTAERDWLWDLAFDTRQRITHNCILASLCEQDTFWTCIRFQKNGGGTPGATAVCFSEEFLRSPQKGRQRGNSDSGNEHFIPNSILLFAKPFLWEHHPSSPFLPAS